MINFNKTALVLIDLQEGILKMDYAPYTAENVVQNANKLIDVFRKRYDSARCLSIKLQSVFCYRYDECTKRNATSISNR